MNASSQADPPELSQAVLRQVNARLRQQLEEAELKIRALEERLRLERIARYGKRSETLSDLQLELLDLEPGVSSDEVAAESDGSRFPQPQKTNRPSRQTSRKPRLDASIPAGRNYPAILRGLSRWLPYRRPMPVHAIRRSDAGDRL